MYSRKLYRCADDEVHIQPSATAATIARPAKVLDLGLQFIKVGHSRRFDGEIGEIASAKTCRTISQQFHLIPLPDPWLVSNPNIAPARISAHATLV
jgi:hypothetical protein